MNTSKDEINKARIALIVSMFIFGTIGVFRRYISLSSSMIALARGFGGMLFLLLWTRIKKEKISFKAIKDNLIFLILSGIVLGFNWLLLFEAYRYTSVATATLCYYMAPIFVILVSPIFFKERLTIQKIICTLMALVGMVLVSGVTQTSFSGIVEIKGILFGLAAAGFYACVILFNKKIRDISAYDKTIMQLGVAAVVLLPYNLVTEDITKIVLTPTALVLLLIVCIIHTGVAYALYFGSMKALETQTIALFSYIDPIVAIILSALFLHEKMGLAGVVGAILVLGATLMSELMNKA